MDKGTSIQILRGNYVVSSMLGVFGRLRETRITSLLGYIMANSPEEFCDAFSIPGLPLSVCVENIHEQNEGDSRADIIAYTPYVKRESPLLNHLITRHNKPNQREPDGD